ncbi:hypothetical protein PRUB_a4031 [Pseudoalteromonas rubra]|uniref:Uncharacterized protein n=1 Tax=Pseudoalteromonas rubra TaxID=43658 RepID=A0A8T0C976_9GAMM|nr:hypothetical protein PRUB_a4031 [Pseudoalteromonas rubra]
MGFAVEESTTFERQKPDITLNTNKQYQMFFSPLSKLNSPGDNETQVGSLSSELEGSFTL